MPRSVVVVLAISALAACDSAVTLAIGSDRPIPTGLDAICVGLADTSASGGSFGRGYRLEGALATLPQTLRVEAGEADSAYAWVRGDRGGVPVARAGAVTTFDDDLTLSLDRCERGGSGAPATRGTAGPAGARLASSQGAGGFLVVAVAADASVVLDAIDGALAEAAAPAAGDAVRDVIAVDLDRDCDDDLLVVREAMPPLLWRREHTTFVEVGTLGEAVATAAAAADVDRDGDLDLVTGRGSTLALWRNDGAGAFTRDLDNLDAAGLVTTVRALALGDLDGDGNPDLVVGQGGDPLVAWLGEPGGTGRFTPSPAAVPAVPLDVRRLALVNADDDLDPDLLVAVAGAPARLYVARDGRLEDQSFVRLPDAPIDAAAIAVGGWDASCEPDVVFATATGTLALRGQSSSVFAADAMAPAATDAVLVDLDDDGTLDLLLATAGGVQWLAR